MTSQEPHTQHIADPDVPDTVVILVDQPAPVFVDSTGRRRRLLRRFAYGFGAFCMVYGGLISLSLAGGPVSPNAGLPSFPKFITGGGEPDVGRPRPTPEPIVTAPKSVLVKATSPRGGAAGGWDGGLAATDRPTARPTRAASPSTRPTGPRATTKPVEATPSPTRTPSPGVSASTPPTGSPVPTGTPDAAPGGTGGGSGTDGEGEGEGEPDDADPGDGATDPDAAPVVCPDAPLSTPDDLGGTDGSAVPAGTYGAEPPAEPDVPAAEDDSDAEFRPEPDGWTVPATGAPADDAQDAP